MLHPLALITGVILAYRSNVEMNPLSDDAQKLEVRRNAASVILKHSNQGVLTMVHREELEIEKSVLEGR